MVRDIVQLEESFPSIRGADSRAFFDEMCCETIDPTLWESFAAGLASMLITVARVVELRATDEVLQDQCCRWRVSHYSMLNVGDRMDTSFCDIGKKFIATSITAKEGEPNNNRVNEERT